MRRGANAVFVLLVVALLAFGAISDRALVEQARSAHDAAKAGAAEKARLTALSVRAALAQVEQTVVTGRVEERVASDRLANPPSRLPWAGRLSTYGERSRAELVKLLDSRSMTPGGLPEAVVARIALGAPPEGRGSRDDVVERLLAGELPVLPEDLAYLACVLGAGNDPRVQTVKARLRRAPDAAELPRLPGFRRALTPRGSVEGWTRDAAGRLRYEVAVADLLVRAGVSERARVTPPAAQEDGPLRRVVPVPDVDGLALSVSVEVPGALRLLALRTALWGAVLCSCLGLVSVRRALGREARAVAREKQFLAGVTHELRTPLSAIRLFGETLAEGRGEPREYGALVARESERLETLVERVLALTRVEEATRFAPARPAEIVCSALELIAPRAARRSVTIRCESEIPALEGAWDADAVRRALLNILENAVTHGREGGRVEVRVDGDAECVRIAVQDDGPGIGRRHRAGLFGRFSRGASGAPGNGLGLYLVDRVARAHGGRVDLVTEEGRGATFTLVLPRVPPGAARQEHA